MNKEERKLIINIVWKPLFAAIMTAVLIMGTGIHPIVIGVTLGIASAAACFLDLKKFLEKK